MVPDKVYLNQAGMSYELHRAFQVPISSGPHQGPDENTLWFPLSFLACLVSFPWLNIWLFNMVLTA